MTNRDDEAAADRLALLLGHIEVVDVSKGYGTANLTREAQASVALDGETCPVESCWCWRCHEERGEPITLMVLCPECGNKRCPKANDHDNACTGSNDPGQPGSAYEHGSWAASTRRDPMLETLEDPDA